MDVQPVERLETPLYPTRREVLIGAAALALGGLSGRMYLFAATADGKTIVAPVFNHGEGRGATGCVVISPPVFLSEEEAMQVVREELKKHGVELKPTKALKDIQMTRRTLIRKESGKKEWREETVEVLGHSNPLALSGADSEKKIAVQFVSQKRYADLGGASSSGPMPDGSWVGSSVHEYDFKEAAAYVAKQVKEQGKESIYLGVFYDPVGPWDRNAFRKARNDKTSKAWDEAEKKGKAESKKQLRLQVQDFVAWLKKEKAIKGP
jgi:hypothetical protein